MPITNSANGFAASPAALLDPKALIKQMPKGVDSYFAFSRIGPSVPLSHQPSQPSLSLHELLLNCLSSVIEDDADEILCQLQILALLRQSAHTSQRARLEAWATC